jgi:hypothetical protein
VLARVLAHVYYSGRDSSALDHCFEYLFWLSHHRDYRSIEICTHIYIQQVDSGFIENRLRNLVDNLLVLALTEIWYTLYKLSHVHGEGLFIKTFP